MADDMVRACIEIARKALSACGTSWREQGDAAVLSMKEALDERFGSSWNVAAGKQFGTKCTHDAKHYISFYLGDILVLFYRT